MQKCGRFVEFMCINVALSFVQSTICVLCPITTASSVFWHVRVLQKSNAHVTSAYFDMVHLVSHSQTHSRHHLSCNGEVGLATGDYGTPTIHHCTNLHEFNYVYVYYPQECQREG